MVTTCAAVCDGTSSGVIEWTTSKRSPVERLDGRRFQAMPREVEGPDRPAAIDPLHALEARSLIASRSFQELENTARSSASANNPPAQRSDELVRVFADAAALAQGRPIIDQDAHLFKSFRVSILL